MRALPSILACALLAACGQAPQPVPAPPAAIAPEPPKGDPVEGLRIATLVGCNGCHERDGRGGGMDLKTPEGDRVVAPNLTQRRLKYDDAGLAKLLHEGKTHDGHRPFGMPIYLFQHLSDREVRDIIAWLRALPAVDNPGLAETSITPATMQRLLDGAHPYATDDKPDPGNAPPAQRPTAPLALGRHLAMTICAECHGRGLDGSPRENTPSLAVIKAYSPEQFARLMRTGEAAAGGDSKPTGYMSKIARRDFSPTLTDAEISALKQYFDSR